MSTENEAPSRMEPLTPTNRLTMLRDDSADILIAPNQYVRVSEMNDETRQQAFTYAYEQIRAALRREVLPWLTP
jgi:hypothetical protein